jgi:[protein-PII] uridylyltransferase
LTLPQEPLAEPVSETGQAHTGVRPDARPDAPTDLICAAGEIFDRAAIEAEIAQAVAGAKDAAAIRKAVVQSLSEANKSGRKTIAAGIKAAPFEAHAAQRAYAWLTDRLVITTLQITLKHLHPRYTPTEGERIAVMAVGGYGRAEMAPSSDVDLLFLIPYKMTAWAESVVESMLYILWDLHLKVGHATRSVRECLRLGREDYTIRTALLEHRYLGGDRPLADELGQRLRTELFKSTASDFVEAKLLERDERHKKQGGQRYMVEPNVKEGKGGLRDLQSMFWIAKYVHDVRRSGELLTLGMFTDTEYSTFLKSEAFLMAVRNQLHLLSRRAVDQLTFDLQVDVAAKLGYVDEGGRRAVEHFMQDYFLYATRVGELTRVFLTALEARHVKQAPSLQRFLRRRKRVKKGYSMQHNRLNVADADVFLSDKLNLLRIFEEALRTGYLIHPDAMRLVALNRDLIDDDMRRNPEAVRIFIDLMLKHGNPERGLRRMNELGVLSSFMPEFKPIVAMMQFNMYHHYTVDEHTIQCISTLAQIEREELIEELPLVSGILKDGVNRKVLYVALLLHDIGKGRSEDHSILGAKIARIVAPRLGLKPDEAETVEWLVRTHLLMSDVAQKRDIADPRTVRDFAKTVKSRKRLDLLTVLTVCDIRGVGPGTWNNWKAVLLRNLYSQTADALEHGLEEVNRVARESEAKGALRQRLAHWSAPALRAELRRHYGPYWQGMPFAALEVFAGLLHGISDDEIRIDLMPDTDRDATRACFALVDHPGIFSRLAGALALVGANVVDARTYTSRDGYATAVFWIQDADGAPYEKRRLPRLRSMIGKTLKGEVVPRDAFRSRDKIKKRESKFRHATTISFDNGGSDIYTMIEVDTRDRPGLLYDLTRTLAAANISIASAQIATYGAQVVDTFYVKDMVGLKLHSESKLQLLEQKLRDAIEAGAKRAKST